MHMYTDAYTYLYLHAARRMKLAIKTMTGQGIHKVHLDNKY